MFVVGGKAILWDPLGDNEPYTSIITLTLAQPSKHFYYDLFTQFIVFFTVKTMTFQTLHNSNQEKTFSSEHFLFAHHLESF
jgi:hypothetical protein